MYAVQRPMRSSVLLALVALAAVVCGLLHMCMAFLPAIEAVAAVNTPSTLPGRRSLLTSASLTAALLSEPLQGTMPAYAEEAADKKAAAAKKSPEALEVSGAKMQKVNGRWSKAFGKKINGRASYQKDGESMYLVFGDCNQFIMVNDKPTGDCEKAFAKNSKDGWSFKGGPNEPAVKVKPISADGKVEQSKAEEEAAQAAEDEKKLQLDSALGKAKRQMDKEFEMAGEFMVMDNEDEEIAGRLLKKFNAKVMGTTQR